LGPVLAPPGSILAPMEPVLAPSRPILAPLGSILAHLVLFVVPPIQTLAHLVFWRLWLSFGTCGWVLAPIVEF
jgi:hypothetical protein